jgi:hypothetical protein
MSTLRRLYAGAFLLLSCLVFASVPLFAAYYPIHVDEASNNAFPASLLSRSPQPDTLSYDDGSPAVLDDAAGLWVDVRFTAPSDFALRTVYVLIYNGLNNSTDACSLYVFADSGGVPAAVVAGPYWFTVPNGLTWYQLDIDTVDFNAGEDFHIMYGPTVGGPPPPGAGPGWWAIFDVSNTGRTQTTTDWTTYVAGAGDAFIRAGGELAQPFTDLANICTGNELDSFFPCDGESVTLTSQIENAGNQDVSSYTVEWMIIDDAFGTTVFSAAGSYGPIAEGETQTVSAPSAWTTDSGHYTVWSDVDATGDADVTNDSSALALQVATSGTAEWHYYDDGGFESTFHAQVGDLWGTEFELCLPSMQVDSIQTSFGLTGAPDSAWVKILLNDGSGDEPGTELWSATALVSDGWNTFFTGGIKVDSGAFTLAYQYASGIGLHRDDSEPTAGTNQCMPTVTWFGTGNPATWIEDNNGDWAMRVYTSPFNLVINEVRPYRDDTGLSIEVPVIVEIYNPSGVGVSLSGWRIGGEEAIFQYALPSWTLPGDCYLEVILDSIGVNDNDFSDRRGTYYTGVVDTLNRESGELGLYDGPVALVNIVDFVTWGETAPPMGDAYNHATAWGIWTSGDYVNVTNFSSFAHLGRIPSGYDTDASSDWYELTQTLVVPFWSDNPIQLTPGDGMAFDTLPDFSWRSLTDASEYLLEVDDDSLFGSPLISVLTIDTAYSSSSVTDGDYFWRVTPTLTGQYPAALFGFSKVTFARQLYGRVPVPQRFQHKDSRLLCIWDMRRDRRRGCDKAAGEMGPWDGEHAQTLDHIDNCNHCRNYCTRASIQMVNAKYNGTLTQDEISYQMKCNKHAGDPEGDLGHGIGAWPLERNAYSWALNNAAVDSQRVAGDGPIPWGHLTSEIDEGQPVLTVIVPPGWFHTVVFDGYLDLLFWDYIHMTDPWPGRTGWYNRSRMTVRCYYRILAANPTGRLTDPDVHPPNDWDGDGVMTFDEGSPRDFECVPFNNDTDNDEVHDKQEIMDYTFHCGRNGDHPNCPRAGIWPTLQFADIDNDGDRTEADCDSDHDSDFDGGEDINGDGRNPVGGLETCMFDNGSLEIWIASLQIPGPWLCTEDVFLFGQTYHEFSWYPYELIWGCPIPQDSMALGWSGILTSVADGVIPMQWIGTFGPGVYRVVVDVLRDHHYNEPDNWDPWLCFLVPYHVKLIIDVPDVTVTSYYTQALDDLEIEYEINTVPPSTPTPGPPYEYLLQFEVVIWVTGNSYFATLLPIDAYNLSMYLDMGGKLFLTGQDIGYDFFEYSPPNDTLWNFYHNYLGAQYVQDNVALTVADGVEGTFMEGFQNVEITGYGGANYEDFYPDEVDPMLGSTMVMQYDSAYGGTDLQRTVPGRSSRRVTFPGMDEIVSSGGACVATEDADNNWRTVYMPYAYEGITDPVARTEILGAVLDWLYGETTTPEPVDVVIQVEGDDIRLEWEPSAGAMSYRIYASEDDPNFVPDSSSLIGAAEETFFIDPDAEEAFEKKFYKVTAVGTVPVGSARDGLRDWIADQDDIDEVTRELERRKVRYIVNRARQGELETSSSFNHDQATEPDYLKQDYIR